MAIPVEDVEVYNQHLGKVTEKAVGADHLADIALGASDFVLLLQKGLDDFFGKVLIYSALDKQVELPWVLPSVPFIALVGSLRLHIEMLKDHSLCCQVFLDIVFLFGFRIELFDKEFNNFGSVLSLFWVLMMFEPFFKVWDFDRLFLKCCEPGAVN